MLRWWVIALWLMAGAGAGFGTAMAAETEFRMITLQHRFAEDILPLVQPMIGDNGSVRAINNYLMVTATPERWAAIEQIIARLGSAGFVDFAALSTIVQVVPGTWFDLGGAMQARDDVSRAILHSEQGKNTRNSSLRIMVE